MAKGHRPQSLGHRFYLVAFSTILIKECNRFLRIWLQTILPPGISMGLYFVIFGHLIGPRIGQMGGFSYMQYIAPGIIMMSVITNAYANVTSSFFGAKFQRHIEEMLVAPVPNVLILAGYVCGGICRGVCVAALVTVVASFFTDLQVHSYAVTFAVVLLTSALFSLGGFINAIFARKFDDISIVPTFVLTPLTYLGGVFYSINLLPPFWQAVSQVNPILYMVNAFRYGVLGISDVNIVFALGMIVFFIIIAGFYAMHLLETSRGLRS